MKTVLLDKTGTITQGRPTLSVIEPLNGGSADDLLAFAAAAESESEHPIARAIVDAENSRNLVIPKADSFQALGGRGLEAMVDRQHVLLGTLRLMSDWAVAIPATASDRIAVLESTANTAFVLGINGQAEAVLAVADTIEEHSSEAIRQIKALGLTPVMVTGDNRLTVRAWQSLSGSRLSRRRFSLPRRPTSCASISRAAPRPWWATVSTMPLRLPRQISVFAMGSGHGSGGGDGSDNVAPPGFAWLSPSNRPRASDTSDHPLESRLDIRLRRSGDPACHCRKAQPDACRRRDGALKRVCNRELTTAPQLRAALQRIVAPRVGAGSSTSE